MKPTIIGHGAEALLMQKGSNLLKDRIKKGYRLQVLDERLRNGRTRHEAKLLEKASSLINVPAVLATDNKEKIKMQFIEGKKLSDWLDKLPEAEKICEEIGRNTAKLHDSDIIHGDLTTSNMILVENSGKNSKADNTKTYNKESIDKKSDLLINDKNNIPSVSEHSSGENDFKVFFIDFGLGFNSRRIEDKAVDLHLLRQALEAKHFSNWQNLFSAVLQGYNSKDKAKILEQLKKVEARGRYKKG